MYQFHTGLLGTIRVSRTRCTTHSALMCSQLLGFHHEELVNGGRTHLINVCLHQLSLHIWYNIFWLSFQSVNHFHLISVVVKHHRCQDRIRTCDISLGPYRNFIRHHIGGYPYTTWLYSGKRDVPITSSLLPKHTLTSQCGWRN
jgi:hypothetical protein